MQATSKATVNTEGLTWRQLPVAATVALLFLSAIQGFGVGAIALFLYCAIPGHAALGMQGTLTVK